MMYRLLVLLLGVLLSQCTEEPAKPLAVGDRAPRFSLVNLAGEGKQLADFTQNGTLLLNFWTTWCTPCKEEMPILNQIYQTYRDQGLTVIGISVEERQDMVTAFSKRYKLDYPILLDTTGRVAKRYGLIGVPKSLVVDRHGVVAWSQKFGGMINHENKEELIEKIKATLK